MRVCLLRRSTLLLLFGCVLIGFALHSCIRSFRSFADIEEGENCREKLRQLPAPSLGRHRDSFAVRNRQLVFVGIMTAEPYLDSRARTIWNTWAQKIPGRLSFFVGQDVPKPSGLPIVSLPGVNDRAYPPQLKSFRMLQHMHAHHIDEYDFFLRADDDVYVHPERLEYLLYGFNASQALYVGQTGLGNAAEAGHLGLGARENYCMGGTGMLLSRETLRRVASHIDECLALMATSHEDVEVGRCIRRFAGASCTWAYEMQQIFVNSNTGFHFAPSLLSTSKTPARPAIPVPNSSFPFDQISPKSVTLHKITQPETMNKLHGHFRFQRISDLRQRLSQLHKDSDLAKTGLNQLQRSFGKRRSRATLEVADFWTQSNVFCLDAINCPRHALYPRSRHALHYALQQVLFDINRSGRQRGRLLDFNDILYGTRRRDAVSGLYYVLDLLLTFRKLKGKRMTAQVRRHTYIQQLFGELRFLEETEQELHETVRVIVPLSGRQAVFERFLSNFVSCCVNGSVGLTVVLFEPDTLFVESLLAPLRRKHPSVQFDVVHLPDIAFSRSIALTEGARHQNGDALLFLVDVDVLFTLASLHRLRLNTQRHRRVYFPVVFSQHDPSFAPFKSDQDTGYFRHFGYGIVAVYRSDLEAVGGFDTSLQGWGYEDVNYFERTIGLKQQPGDKTANLTVIRACEPDFVHIYHKVECDNSTMLAKQMTMCLNSRASNFASLNQLTSYVHNNSYSFAHFLHGG